MWDIATIHAMEAARERKLAYDRKYQADRRAAKKLDDKQFFADEKTPGASGTIADCTRPVFIDEQGRLTYNVPEGDKKQ